MGGNLAGQIEGDCQQPALLENVKVKTGSVLKCVALGKNVKMEKGVMVEEK
jgi:ADP-glucose pyrophosphorylase